MIIKNKNNIPYIIAEIGSNNNGSMTAAKKLITNAKIAGCDAVKFQSWDKGLYDISTMKLKEISKLESLIMNFKKLKILKKFAKRKKIDFGTSVFSQSQIDEAIDMKCDFIKIASMDFDNFKLIDYALKKKKIPLIISTGFSTHKEIIEMGKKIKLSKRKNVYLLHCVSVYPPNDTTLNLNNILQIQKDTKIPTGFSDHTIDPFTPIIATAMGAKIIEKHFTLNKRSLGADHMISADLREMKIIVSQTKRVNIIRGSKKRKLSSKEISFGKIMKRSIFAKKNIKKGEIFSEENIVAHRPGTGLSPKIMSKIIGKKSKIYIKKNKMLKINNF